MHNRFLLTLNVKKLLVHMGWLFLMAYLSACVEKAETANFVILSVSPSVLEPETSIIIEGKGFGGDPNVVAISGQPLRINSWSDQRVVATVPANISVGERFLVLSRDGQQTPPYPVFVSGDLTPRLRSDQASFPD